MGIVSTNIAFVRRSSGSGGDNGADLPTHLKSLSANGGNKLVTLTLEYENTDLITGVQVNYKTENYPTSPSDGDYITVMGAATSIKVTGLTNTLTYYFRVFLYCEVDGVKYYQTDITNSKITCMPNTVEIVGATIQRQGTNFIAITTSGKFTLSAPAGARIILGGGGNGGAGGSTKYTGSTGAAGTGTSLVIDGKTYSSGSTRQILSTKAGLVGGGGSGGDGGNGANGTEGYSTVRRGGNGGDGGRGGDGASPNGSGGNGGDGGRGGDAHEYNGTGGVGGTGGNGGNGGNGGSPSGAGGIGGCGGEGGNGDGYDDDNNLYYGGKGGNGGTGGSSGAGVSGSAGGTGGTPYGSLGANGGSCGWYAGTFAAKSTMYSYGGRGGKGADGKYVSNTSTKAYSGGDGGNGGDGGYVSVTTLSSPIDGAQCTLTVGRGGQGGTGGESYPTYISAATDGDSGGTGVFIIEWDE